MPTTQWGNLIFFKYLSKHNFDYKMPVNAQNSMDWHETIY